MSDQPRQTIADRLIKPPNERDHIQGPTDAPVTLVTYGDFECPYCADAYRATERLREEMDDVRFVFRHFPLEMHPNAWQAAEAAEAAAAQGKFWEMHDLLYEHRDALETDDLQEYAEELGLDVDYFTQELEGGAFTERVQEDILSGARSGVNGTPTFFINGERYDQQWDSDILRAALEDATQE